MRHQFKEIQETLGIIEEIQEAAAALCAHAAGIFASEAEPTDDFFMRQATTSLDYAVHSELWRFLTGGLNVQAIHHVLPVVNSCHYTKLYPKFFAICEKHGCAPAVAPGILAASYRHLKHVYDLGELYTGPHLE